MTPSFTRRAEKLLLVNPCELRALRVNFSSLGYQRGE